MSTTTIHIKNMCCQRCVEAVGDVLQHMGVQLKSIRLGEADVIFPGDVSLAAIDRSLEIRGFGLITSTEEKISEQVKVSIHKLFSFPFSGNLTDFDLAEYLENRIGVPYRKLASVFTSANRKTIESYYILHRIETAKAMIEETDKSFTLIAFDLGYKSLSHLSRQFKSIEGFSMHDYKVRHRKTRKYINEL